MNGLKRPVAATCIGAFAVAALLGIVALLRGGNFGETEVDILLTTVIVGITCIAVLCALTTTGTRWQAIGVFGALSAFAGAALALAATWGDFSGDDIYRALGVACTLAAACAWASLVLVASTGRTAVSRAAGSITAIGLVIGAAMIIVPIIVLPDWSNWYWRILGAVAIVTVLATIVAIATAQANPVASSLVASSPVADARVAAAARARGITPEQFVREAVEAALGIAEPRDA